MDIKHLINEMHEIKQQRLQLLEREQELKLRQTELESSIKTVLDELNEEYESLSEEDFQMLLSDMAISSMLNAEVVYALPKKQFLKEIQVPEGATIEDSITLSVILTDFPAGSDQCVMFAHLMCWRFTRTVQIPTIDKNPHAHRVVDII